MITDLKEQDPFEREIRQAINDRSEYEEKQRTWYLLRHGMIPRKREPYPGAPDQKARLIDEKIDKLKPFYVQLLYGAGQLAQFMSLESGGVDQASAAAAWFDYQMKQKSNFEREAISAIDVLLEGGGCPMKVYWDPDCKRIAFDACSPVLVIVPPGTEELHKADWLVHVLRISQAQYRRNKYYNHDGDLIKRISGKGDGTARSGEAEMRAGLNCGRNDREIIVWECFKRDDYDYNKIMVQTRSPMFFKEPLKEDYELPYTQGVFAEGWLPFVQWRGEITGDKDYHAPRGQAEILAPHEVGMSKAWNYILEHMDFHSRPMFEREPGVQLGNVSNWQSGPGSILPEGLKRAANESIPPSLFEERNYVRQAAEHRSAAPDFSVIGEQGGKRTATEISAIAGQTGQGTDLRSRIFRLDLGDTYRMAWSILRDKAADSLAYIMDGEVSSIEEGALQRSYEISPNGSADSWNKGQQFAKALERFQTLRNDPFIKQGELRKDLLAADEAGSIKRLYQEPQDVQLGEVEEQHMELLLMNNRFAAKVDETDDDATHLQAIAQWFPVRMQEQPPLDPIAAGLVFQHIQEHGQAIYAKKDPRAKQLDQLLKPISAILQQIAAQHQENVVPMQGQQQPAMQ